MAQSLNRREFVAASAIALPLWRSVAFRTGASWPGYARATVIDCLASPGPFNTPDSTDAPLTDEMVANAKGSGMTAINVTLSGGGPGHTSFDSTVVRIGYWERELAAHPDVFTKIRTVADLAESKRTGRVGLIYGFQDAVMLEGDPTRLDLFHRYGVKIVQLTYNVAMKSGMGAVDWLNGTQLTLGCNDVFDKHPPFSSGSGSAFGGY